MRNPAESAGVGTLAAVAWLSLAFLFHVFLKGGSVATALEASKEVLGCSVGLLIFGCPFLYVLGLPLQLLFAVFDERLSRGAVVAWSTAAGALLGLLYPVLIVAFRGSEAVVEFLGPSYRGEQIVALGAGAAFGVASAWHLTRPEKS